MEMDKKQANQWVLILVLVSVLVLAYGTYSIGGYNTCVKSEGTLVSGGTCVNYSSLAYCVGEEDGLIKKMPSFLGEIE